MTFPHNPGNGINKNAHSMCLGTNGQNWGTASSIATGEVYTLTVVGNVAQASHSSGVTYRTCTLASSSVYAKAFIYRSGSNGGVMDLPSLTPPPPPSPPPP